MICQKYRSTMWSASILTAVFAARVGGASGEVAFDFLTATLPGVVLRALVAGATTFATLRLLELGPFTLHLIGVVDKIVTTGTVVWVAVDLVWRFRWKGSAAVVRRILFHLSRALESKCGGNPCSPRRPWTLATHGHYLEISRRMTVVVQLHH